MAGSNLAGSNLYASNLAGSLVAGSNLAGSLVAGSNLAGSVVAGSLMAGSNLAGSVVAGSLVAGSNLAGSRVAGSNLAGSNLTGSLMAGSNLVVSNAGVYIKTVVGTGTGTTGSGTIGTSSIATAQNIDKPCAILLDNNNDMYVGCRGGNLFRVSSSNGQITLLVNVTGGVYFMCWNKMRSYDTIIITCNTAIVYKYIISTNTLESLINFTNINNNIINAAGIDCDNSGNLYVSTNSGVYKGTLTDTSSIGTMSLFGTNNLTSRENGYAIYIDNQNNIYFSQSLKIVMYNSAGTSSIIYSGGYDIGAITKSAAGNIYVQYDYIPSDKKCYNIGILENSTIRYVSGSNQSIPDSIYFGIQTYAANTTSQENVPASRGTFGSPNMIAVDNNDNIYVADRYNERIRQIYYSVPLISGATPTQVNGKNIYTITNTSTTTTITVLYSVYVWLLLVGGGGQGGFNLGGGGGGGGVYENKYYYLQAGTYTITIGSGIASVKSGTYTLTNGGNTTIAINNETLFAAGGGGAGGNQTSSNNYNGNEGVTVTATVGAVGGSGGGASGRDSAGTGRSAGTNGSGSGGNGLLLGGNENGSNYRQAAGGGGGAGGNGSNGSVSTGTWTGYGGNGGDGLISSITGSSITYGGGGGGNGVGTGSNNTQGTTKGSELSYGTGGQGSGSTNLPDTIVYPFISRPGVVIIRQL